MLAGLVNLPALLQPQHQVNSGTALASSPYVVSSKGQGDSPARMPSGLACPHLNHQGQLFCAAYSRATLSSAVVGKRQDQVPCSSDFRDNSPREGPSFPKLQDLLDTGQQDIKKEPHLGPSIDDIAKTRDLKCSEHL